MISLGIWLLVVGALTAPTSSPRLRADIDLWKWTDHGRHRVVITSDERGIFLPAETYGAMLLRLDEEFLYRCDRETKHSEWSCEPVDRYWWRGRNMLMPRGGA